MVTSPSGDLIFYSPNPGHTKIRLFSKDSHNSSKKKKSPKQKKKKTNLQNESPIQPLTIVLCIGDCIHHVTNVISVCQIIVQILLLTLYIAAAWFSAQPERIGHQSAIVVASILI